MKQSVWVGKCGEVGDEENDEYEDGQETEDNDQFGDNTTDNYANSTGDEAYTTQDEQQDGN